MGSLRRECLDHVVVLGVLQLMRILKEYVGYFNRARPVLATPVIRVNLRHKSAVLHSTAARILPHFGE